MLKLRVITALVAAPTVIAAIFYLPPPAFAAVFLLLAGVGLYEWANLAGLDNRIGRAGYLGVFLLSGYALWQWPQAQLAVFSGVVVAWVLAAIIVMTFPRSARVLVPSVLLAAGYVLLLGAWLALVVLVASAGGAWSILWVFSIVWSADIGAYFVGRRFGRRRLATHVSPGKTWEGAIGGVVLALIVGTVLGVTVPSLAGLGFDRVQWMVAAAAIAVISVFGDLFESALKRVRGVKDSGTIFPGHGGMLDRIDSLLAALPCFAFVVAQHP
jgi:phosphatidate cytidylyltransferase